MKKIILLFSVLICARGFAQNHQHQSDQSRKEKVEAMKVAFITEKLDLTPAEAQKFWPVYNEFEKKREELHKKRREETMKMRENLDSLSDKQIETFVDGEMSFKQKNLDLEKEYHSKFKSVLPIRKLAKLYRAEEMFSHHLLEQLSNRNKDGHSEKKRNDEP